MSTESTSGGNKIQLGELEKLLDKLKGEENIFSINKTGKDGEEKIKEISDLFLSTGLKDVSRFDETLQNLKYKRSKAVSVKGEKGTGKSTLVSSLVMKNFYQGNVDEIFYFRYNQDTKKFDQIFSQSRDSPKTRAICLDDILYFTPDWTSGKVSNFVRSLDSVSSLYKESKHGTILVYVADGPSLNGLLEIYDSVTRSAGRSDVSAKLPWLPPTSKLSNPNEFEVGREFFGKTYSILGGNKDDYHAANLFAELIRKDTGIFANNPRLLKYIINQVGNLKHVINPNFFSHLGITEKLLKGEITVEPKSYFKSAQPIVMEFLKNFNKYDYVVNTKAALNEFLGRFEEEYSEKYIDNLVSSLDALLTEDKKNANLDHYKIYKKIGTDSNNFVWSDFGSYERDIRMLINSCRGELERIGIASRDYSPYKRSQIKQYQESYSAVRNAVENYVSKNPVMFSQPDSDKLKELAENPRKFVSDIIKKRLSAGMPVY